jgi:hypothetical protein
MKEYNGKNHFMISAKHIKDVEILRAAFKKRNWACADLLDIIGLAGYVSGRKTNLALVQFITEMLGEHSLEPYCNGAVCPLEVLKFLQEKGFPKPEYYSQMIHYYFWMGMTKEYEYMQTIAPEAAPSGDTPSILKTTSLEHIKLMWKCPQAKKDLRNIHLGHYYKDHLAEWSLEVFQFMWDKQLDGITNEKRVPYWLGLFGRIDLYDYMMSTCGKNPEMAMNFVRGLLGVSFPVEWRKRKSVRHVEPCEREGNINQSPEENNAIRKIFAEFNIHIDELDRAIEHGLWRHGDQMMIDSLSVAPDRVRHNNYNILSFAIHGENFYAVQKLRKIMGEEVFQEVLPKLKFPQVSSKMFNYCVMEH